MDTINCHVSIANIIPYTQKSRVLETIVDELNEPAYAAYQNGNLRIVDFEIADIDTDINDNCVMQLNVTFEIKPTTKTYIELCGGLGHQWQNMY